MTKFFRKNIRFFILLFIAIVLGVPMAILMHHSTKGEIVTTEEETPSASDEEEPSETELPPVVVSPDDVTDPVQDENMESIEVPETENPALSNVPPRSDVMTHYGDLGVVTADNFLNVRETPWTGAKVIGKAWKFSALNIIENNDDGWYKIQSGKVEGYVAAEFVAIGDEAKRLAEANSFLMAKVNAERLNVRTEPTTDGYVWTQLNCDELQTVSEVYDGWLQVVINNSVGYISSDFVDLGYYLNDAVPWNPLDNTTETRRKLIEYGMSFLGTPYVYGGMSLTEGIDCSGFTQVLYKQFECDLHRESYNQQTQGVDVGSIDYAKPGDLVFYTDSEGQVNHVAIYIGSGQILHACESRGGIVITTYNYSTEPSYIKDVLPGR